MRACEPVLGTVEVILGAVAAAGLHLSYSPLRTVWLSRRGLGGGTLVKVRGQKQREGGGTCRQTRHVGEYVIPKEGPGTARDEEGTAGADAPSSEGAAGSSG